jgi:glycosyltransferase involved in cell wall biosynthesis
MKEVSIIIKTLNEEKNIERAIKSALAALKGIKGEVIVADSLSKDRTIEIAKKHPVRIVQLRNPKQRSCGAGPQLGYIHSKGKYVYILDGDMELDRDFIKKGMKHLEKEPKLAGVGGIITEMTGSNIVFRRRQKSEASSVVKERLVNKLMMGGLYSRKAVELVGKFSNPSLHSYEESDLGHALTGAGYKLKRLPIPMVRHYGISASSAEVFARRWKSRYLWGAGELLRANLGRVAFWKSFYDTKLYIAVLLWWFSLTLLIILRSPLLLAQTLLTFIFILLLLVRKRCIKETIYSLFSWNITALGLLLGFLSYRKTRELETKVIK